MGSMCAGWINSCFSVLAYVSGWRLSLNHSHISFNSFDDVMLVAICPMAVTQLPTSTSFRAESAFIFISF